MGYNRTHFSAATAAQADDDRFFVAAAMKNGAYALLLSGAMPSEGARKVTFTHATVAAGTDTLGTLEVIYRNLAGETITETITPVADSAVETTGYAVTLVSVTGDGWAIVGGNDTIKIGCGADAIVAIGTGTLHGVAVNTTAAGAITLADSAGTIAVLKASIAEGLYLFDCQFSSYLKVTLAAASDVTVLHSGSMPTSYSK